MKEQSEIDESIELTSEKSSTKRASDEISVTGSTNTENQDIIKPLKEDREMKFLRLKNDMKVLLV